MLFRQFPLPVCALPLTKMHNYRDKDKNSHGKTERKQYYYGPFHNAKI